MAGVSTARPGALSARALDGEGDDVHAQVAERPVHPAFDPSRRRRRARLLLGVLAATLVVAMLASWTLGPATLSAGDVAGALLVRLGLEVSWPVAPHAGAVAIDIRAPRLLLGAGVGATLALAGAVLQGLFRNPLAEPALVGISSGAAVAVVAVIVAADSLATGAGAGALAAGQWTLPLAAFAGAMTTAVVVHRLSLRGGRSVMAATLLAGIGINALAGALTGVLVYVADDVELRTLTFWTLGSLGSTTWSTLALAAPFLLVALAGTVGAGAELNALALGEREAAHLGVRVEALKRRLLVLVCLGSGAAVAVSGVIGFVGLVAPHVVRLAAGPDHRLLLPASMLAGALLVVVADTGARTVVAPAELPIGVVTALVGAPTLLWLVRRHREVR